MRSFVVSRIIRADLSFLLRDQALGDGGFSEPYNQADASLVPAAYCQGFAVLHKAARYAILTSKARQLHFGGYERCEREVFSNMRQAISIGGVQSVVGSGNPKLHDITVSLVLRNSPARLLSELISYRALGIGLSPA